VPLGLVDRPITISLIVGLFGQDIQLCLGTGIFFELLWMDSLPAGTYIPPQRQFPLFLTLAISSNTSIINPNIFYILLLIAIPFAYIGKWLERLHRMAQNKDYDKITKKIITLPSYHLGHRLINSLTQLLLINTSVFFISCIIIMKALSIIHTYIPLSKGAEINWPALWALSFIGGILSLRIKKSYLTFLVSYVALAIILLFFQ